mgnify:FL=1
MHIEIDRDNKQIVLTFVGSDEKELFDMLENIKATLETKYDGETKVILKSRLYVEGDVVEDPVGTGYFIKDFNESLGKALSYDTWFDHMSEVLKEEDVSVGHKVTTPDFARMKPKYVACLSPFNMDYLKIDLKWVFSDPSTISQHGRRFQRLRQKQWFKK